VTQVRVFPDLQHLSRAAAECVVSAARHGVRARGRFSVALAGGSTPRVLYRLLACTPYRAQMPWPSVHCFWTDERCVPPEHAKSNFRMAHTAWLSHVPLPPANIHRIVVEQRTPAQAAARYAQVLRAFFPVADGAWPAFDLILLGLGEDGHTAALFPRSPAVQETRRLVTPSVGDRPALPRITLTLPVLNHARQLLWLVAGRRKAAIVRLVLQGQASPETVPARRVRPVTGDACWFLDQAAARQLLAS